MVIEMANKENLTVSAERASDTELQQRFDDINRGIQAVWKDKIEIPEWTLNWQFAEYLLRPENKNALEALKKDVDKLRKDWKPLWSKAWKGLDNLATFLDDIENQDRMKKDYDEFMKKIKTPKKLNTMKSWEIRRLNIYLWSHEDDAYRAYEAMKPI